MKSLFTQSAFWRITFLPFCLFLFTACNSDDPAIEQKVKIDWSPTNGPDGGEVLVVAAVDDRIVAGTYWGIFVSDNNGDTWTRVSDEAALSIVATTDKLYATTLDGIMASSDDGDSWQDFGSLGQMTTSFLAVGADLFAGSSYSGVFKSAGVNSWNEVNNGLTNLKIRALATNGSRIFAGTEGGGVFISDDLCEKWTASNSGLANLNVHTLLVVKDYVFAGTQGGVFVSSDNGVTWVSTALQGLITFRLESQGSDILAGTNGGVWSTSNLGATWTSMNNGLSNYIVRGLLANGDRLYSGTQDGVFLSSDNGQSWQRKNDGLVSQSVIALAWHNDKLYAGTYGTVHVTSDAGAHWNVANSHPLSQFVEALAVNGNTILQGNDGASFISTDGGVTWEIMPELNGMPINEFLIDGNGWYASAVAYGVFVSTDNGQHWTAMNTGLTEMQVRGMGKSGDHLFVGTNGAGIFRSTSGGNWVQVNNGLSEHATLFVNDLIEFDGKIIAGTVGGILISEDNGETWKKTLSDVYTNELSTGSGLVVAASYQGVYVSRDGGESWTVENWSLKNKQVRSVAVGKDKIAIGVEGGGTFVSPLPTVRSE
jgi:hypothetical protein